MTSKHYMAMGLWGLTLFGSTHNLRAVEANVTQPKKPYSQKLYEVVHDMCLARQSKDENKDEVFSLKELELMLTCWEDKFQQVKDYRRVINQELDGKSNDSPREQIAHNQKILDMMQTLKTSCQDAVDLGRLLIDLCQDFYRTTPITEDEEEKWAFMMRSIQQDQDVLHTMQPWIDDKIADCNAYIARIAQEERPKKCPMRQLADWQEDKEAKDFRPQTVSPQQFEEMWADLWEDVASSRCTELAMKARALQPQERSTIDIATVKVEALIRNLHNWMLCECVKVEYTSQQIAEICLAHLRVDMTDSQSELGCRVMSCRNSVLDGIRESFQNLKIDQSTKNKQEYRNRAKDFIRYFFAQSLHDTALRESAMGETIGLLRPYQKALQSEFLQSESLPSNKWQTDNLDYVPKNKLIKKKSYLDNYTPLIINIVCDDGALPLIKHFLLPTWSDVYIKRCLSIGEPLFSLCQQFSRDPKSWNTSKMSQKELEVKNTLIKKCLKIKTKKDIANNIEDVVLLAQYAIKHRNPDFVNPQDKETSIIHDFQKMNEEEKTHQNNMFIMMLSLIRSYALISQKNETYLRNHFDTIFSNGTIFSTYGSLTHDLLLQHASLLDLSESKSKKAMEDVKKWFCLFKHICDETKEVKPTTNQSCELLSPEKKALAQEEETKENICSRRGGKRKKLAQEEETKETKMRSNQ